MRLAVFSSSAVAALVAAFVIGVDRDARFHTAQRYIRSHTERSSAISAGHTEVVMTFYNVHNETLDLYYRGPGGQDIRMASVASGRDMEFSTWVGHQWSWRAPSTQVTVKSFFIEKNAPNFVYSLASPSWYEEYYKKHSIPWINVHPRGPVTRWIPDPFAIGHEHEVEVAGGLSPLRRRVQKMVTQSVAPRVFVIEDFLSADECDHIVHLAASRGMHRSLVKSTTVSTSWFGASSPVVVSDERTSTNTWLSATASNIVENVFIRAFDLLKIPFDADRWRQHCEDMQVLRYDVSQEYQPHDDYFLPATTRYSRHVQSGHNRYATLLLYLNDVAHGGETVFPRAHSTFIENGCPNSSSAMKIQPKKGRAVLFFSMRPDGNLDQSALHGGCPVIEGTKWAANLWFWDERYGK